MSRISEAGMSLSRVRNPIQISHMGGRNPTPGSINADYEVCIGRSWNKEPYSGIKVMYSDIGHRHLKWSLHFFVKHSSLSNPFYLMPYISHQKFLKLFLRSLGVFSLFYRLPKQTRPISPFYSCGFKMKHNIRTSNSNSEHVQRSQCHAHVSRLPLWNCQVCGEDSGFPIHSKLPQLTADAPFNFE